MLELLLLLRVCAKILSEVRLFRLRSALPELLRLIFGENVHLLISRFNFSPRISLSFLGFFPGLKQFLYTAPACTSIYLRGKSKVLAFVFLFNFSKFLNFLRDNFTVTDSLLIKFSLLIRKIPSDDSRFFWSLFRCSECGKHAHTTVDRVYFARRRLTGGAISLNFLYQSGFDFFWEIVLDSESCG